MNQSCENFRWIVMFYEEIPERFKKNRTIKKIGEGKILPLLMTEEECGSSAFILVLSRMSVKKEAENRKEAIIVITRMDNDDCIHCDYIRKYKI